MLAVDPYLIGWLDLVFRWFHVAAAIVWIGTSFYFVALDNHLREPEDTRDRERGVGGETWEIHGGGFYRVEKFTVAPAQLPETLHWYKWEAYWTWISGFTLLVVLYYLEPRTYLIDPTVANLAPGRRSDLARRSSPSAGSSTTSSAGRSRGGASSRWRR